MSKILFVVLIFAVQTVKSAGLDSIELMSDLSGYHYKVTTNSTEAQKYFDQGFVLYYSFNHAPAIASFTKAAEVDPNCAMAWWGRAISAGPHINNPFMDDAAAQSAWEAVQQAKQLLSKATPLERELINAVASRYAWPRPEDRKSLDIAYADAMREVWLKHQENPDVGALYADAMMMRRPWDLWTTTGEPQPGTPEIMAVLERVMKIQPDHPGACHFYIHTVEASPFPGVGLAAADVLRTRIPGAGHLVHMPAHIDIRLGHYDDAIKANQLGVIADQRWKPLGGFYSMYRAHNYHFLAYAAMFEGRRDLATKAARDMIENVSLVDVRAIPDVLEAFMAVPYHVQVRFGLWDEILKEPEPEADLQTTRATWRYARTVALAAQGKVQQADAEYALLVSACKEIPESRYVGNNAAKVVMEIGLTIAKGEVEYRKGNYDAAFASLREAVRLDDELRYDEPWGWMMPARHALGALLLEQGQVAEAGEVYQDDLELHPGNGWALHGLSECMRRSGRIAEADALDLQFKAAWQRSDIEIAASCYCRTGQSKQ